MTTSVKLVEVELIECEICLREVPITEATSPEAADYVVYFCGLECYDKWMNQDKKPEDQVGKSGL